MKRNAELTFIQGCVLRDKFQSALGKKTSKEVAFENFVKTHFVEMATAFFETASMTRQLGDVISLIAESKVFAKSDPEAHDQLVTLALRYQLFKDNYFHVEDET